MQHPHRVVLLLCFVSIGAAPGCNLLTGADDLHASRDGDPSDEPTGAGGAGYVEPGNEGTGAGPDDGDTETPPDPGDDGSSPPGPTGPMGFADGVSITDVDLYQGVRRPLVQAGQPAASDLPVVAGRDGLLRIFYQTTSGYDGLPVTARLTVSNAATVEHTTALIGTSSQAQLSSTINLDVPGNLLTPGAEFRVELLQPAPQSSGANVTAAYPSSGASAPMGVQAGGKKLRILLVPVQSGGTLPDTSPAQVDRYQTLFREIYPVPEVEVMVRSQAYSFPGALTTYQGWSDLLDDISDLRSTDNASDDVYYYGIHAVDAGGLLGLGWVAGPSDVWNRAAIGVGWTGMTSAETAVHEVGHNHGREHAPCGVPDPDLAFPHPGASIGTWGYSPSRNELLAPTGYVDFMSYCEPAWISDYTFKALFARLTQVSNLPRIYVSPELANRTYDRIKVLGNGAYWKDAVQRPRPPVGESLDLQILTAGGDLRAATGSYFRYSEPGGGMLLVMRPRSLHPADQTTEVTFSIDGKTFTLTH